MEKGKGKDNVRMREKKGETLSGKKKKGRRDTKNKRKKKGAREN